MTTHDAELLADELLARLQSRSLFRVDWNQERQSEAFRALVAAIEERTRLPVLDDPIEIALQAWTNHQGAFIPAPGSRERQCVVAAFYGGWRAAVAHGTK